MGTKTWWRQRNAGTVTGVPWRVDMAMVGLNPTDTVIRTIVTFDWWVDSNLTEFIDVGAQINYGVSPGSSVLAPTITPWTDFASTNPRWLYWDQLDVTPIEIYDVASTVYYLAKNRDASRYIDTRTQYKNNSGAIETLWFSIEPDPAAPSSWSDVYWAVSSSVLVETFP